MTTPRYGLDTPKHFRNIQNIPKPRKIQNITIEYFFFSKNDEKYSTNLYDSEGFVHKSGPLNLKYPFYQIHIAQIYQENPSTCLYYSKINTVALDFKISILSLYGFPFRFSYTCLGRFFLL